MGIITSAEPISKTKYRIFIDGQFAFVLHKGDLLHYEIREDSSISDETREEILEEIIYKEAKGYVNRLLMAADKTEKQLRDSMKRKEYPENIIDRVILLCEEQRLLDDARYAEHYVTSAIGSKSVRMIRMELQKRGVSESMIDEVLRKFTADADENPEKNAIMKVLRKKNPSGEELSYEAGQKLFAYLLRKGFSYDSVREAMRDYAENGGIL